MKVERGTLVMKDTIKEYLGVEQAQMVAIIEAIDKGYIESLRHFAEHGSLPHPAPIWGEGTKVGHHSTKDRKWWTISRDGIVIAKVEMKLESTTLSHEFAALLYLSIPVVDGIGDSPQEAVDDLKKKLREYLEL